MNIEKEVCKDIQARQELGIAKYGTTVADNNLPLGDWLQHAYEECLDQAVYLKRAMVGLGTVKLEGDDFAFPHWEEAAAAHWVDCDGYVSKEVSEPDRDFPMVVRILTDGGYVWDDDDDDDRDHVGQLRKARRYSLTILDVFDADEGSLSYFHDNPTKQDEVEVIYEG